MLNIYSPCLPVLSRRAKRMSPGPKYNFQQDADRVASRNMAPPPESNPGLISESHIYPIHSTARQCRSLCFHDRSFLRPHARLPASTVLVHMLHHLIDNNYCIARSSTTTLYLRRDRYHLLVVQGHFQVKPVISK